MKQKHKKTMSTLIIIAPFILMSIADYTIPMITELTIRTSILFYIHGAINQLIATVLGFLCFYRYNNSPTQAEE